MRKVLSELNRIPGVQGSLIITKDGIVVASEMKGDLKEEVVAAISSAMVLSVTRSLEELKGGAFNRFTVTCSAGKIIIEDAGIAFLIVVAEKDINLGLIFVEIRTAIKKIKNLGTLKV